VGSSNRSSWGTGDHDSAEPTVEITMLDDPAVVVAHLAGEIDLVVTDQVRADLDAALAAHEGGVVLDLSATTYLDSSGVRLLYDLAGALQREHRHLALCVTDDAIVRRVLLLTNLDAHVRVETNLASAVAAVSG